MSFVGFESDCVGCETCINCGRRNKYAVFECDNCHKETTNEDDLVYFDASHYCEKCYTELFDNEYESEE